MPNTCVPLGVQLVSSIKDTLAKPGTENPEKDCLQCGSCQFTIPISWWCFLYHSKSQSYHMPSFEMKVSTKLGWRFRI